MVSDLSTRPQHKFTVGTEKVLSQDSFEVVVYNVDFDRMYDISNFVRSIQYGHDVSTGFATINVMVKNDPTIRHHLRSPNWIVLRGPYWSYGPSEELRNELSGVQEVNVEELIANTGLTEPEQIADAIATYRDQQRRNLIFDITERFNDQMEEIDRGIIVEVKVTHGDDNTISVTAKDPTWYLTKNNIPYKIPEANLTNRLRVMQSLGHIHVREPLIVTRHIIPSTRGGERSLYNEILFDINETNRHDGKRYRLRHRKGEHYIDDDTRQDFLWGFVVGKNIMKLDTTYSMEGYYNRVYVIETSKDSYTLLDEHLTYPDLPPLNDQVAIVGFAQNENDFDKYGLQSLTVSSGVSSLIPSAEYQSYKILEDLNKIEQTITLDTFSIPSIKVGNGILIYDPVLNLAGVYWVRAFNHQIRGASATMTINADLDYIADERYRKDMEESSEGLLDIILPYPDEEETPNTPNVASTIAASEAGIIAGGEGALEQFGRNIGGFIRGQFGRGEPGEQ